MVNNKGRDIDDRELLAAAVTVGVAGQTVREFIEQVDKALAGVGK